MHIPAEQVHVWLEHCQLGHTNRGFASAGWCLRHPAPEYASEAPPPWRLDAICNCSTTASPPPIFLRLLIVPPARSASQASVRVTGGSGRPNMRRWLRGDDRSDRDALVSGSAIAGLGVRLRAVARHVPVLAPTGTVRARATHAAGRSDRFTVPDPVARGFGRSEEGMWLTEEDTRSPAGRPSWQIGGNSHVRADHPGTIPARADR